MLVIWEICGYTNMITNYSIIKIFIYLLKADFMTWKKVGDLIIQFKCNLAEIWTLPSIKWFPSQIKNKTCLKFHIYFVQAQLALSINITQKKENYLIRRIVYMPSGLYSIYTTRLVQHIYIRLTFFRHSSIYGFWIPNLVDSKFSNHLFCNTTAHPCGASAH
jgi:hypothetical protein